MACAPAPTLIAKLTDPPLCEKSKSLVTIRRVLAPLNRMAELVRPAVCGAPQPMLNVAPLISSKTSDSELLLVHDAGSKLLVA